MTWKTSSYCGELSYCVEVSTGAVVRVRDTKNHDLGHLTVGGAAWEAFLDQVCDE